MKQGKELLSGPKWKRRAGKSEKKDLEHGGDVKRRGTGSSRSGAIWRGGLCSAAWCWAGGKLEKLADVTNRMAMPCPDGCGQGGTQQVPAATGRRVKAAAAAR